MNGRRRFCLQMGAVAAALSLAMCAGDMGNMGTPDGGRKTGDGGVDPGQGPGQVDPGPRPTREPDACTACVEHKQGIGGTPYDTGASGSEFVSQDPDGALVIDRAHSRFNRYLWVADTNLPGVSKIDLQTMQIVARYRTGGASTSRTTVNVLGEVFIGARASGGQGKFGVTKVLPHGQDCPDTNNDGKVTTSTGPDHVLPYGQDDCVAWHVALDGDIRGLAAEDISGVKHKEICQGAQVDSEFVPTKIDTEDEHYVWAGGVHGKVYKLNAATGEVLINTQAPNGVYGMALSQADDKLWVTHGGLFGFIDIARCKDQASCDAAVVCTQACTETACDDTCDGAVKTKYTGAPAGYGITVDLKNRVWRSGHPAVGVMRFDPYAPVNQRLKWNPKANAGGGGIAADADGFIWSANYRNTGTVRTDAETLESITIPSVKSKGVALGTQGEVYAIQQNPGLVQVIHPGPSKTLQDYTVDARSVALKGMAYAYSDMTGTQARLASNDPGWYRQVVHPCPEGDTARWQYLTWDVEAPRDTWAMFNVRVAESAGELGLSPWSTVACIAAPGSKGFVDLSYIQGKVLEVEVRLVAAGDMNNADTVESARIKSFAVLNQCLSSVD